jgi:hypothetical protein
VEALKRKHHQPVLESDLNGLCLNWGRGATRLHCEVRASKGKFIVHEARRTIIEMEDPMSIPPGAIPKSGDFDSAIRSLPGTTCDTLGEDPRSAFNFAGHLLLGGEVFGQMEHTTCIPVEYRYRREPRPKSNRWHMNCHKAAPQPSLLPIGETEVIIHGDQVSIYINVPCDEQGNVDEQTQAEYEDMADHKFRGVKPRADLA